MEEYKAEEIKAVRPTTYDMKGLRLCLYGLLLTVINLEIQGFDIVPDVIGYIMVLIGLGRIEQYEKKLTGAKKAAIVLTALSAINVYKPQGGAGNVFPAATNVTFSAGIFGNVPWLAALLMIVGVAANIYFAFAMCMGLKNLLIRTGDATLAGICDDRWKLILAAQGGLIFSLLLVFLMIPFGIVIAAAFGILLLIAMILFLLLIHHASRSIDGKEVINAEDIPQMESLIKEKMEKNFRRR